MDMNGPVLADNQLGRGWTIGSGMEADWSSMTARHSYRMAMGAGGC